MSERGRWLCFAVLLLIAFWAGVALLSGCTAAPPPQIVTQVVKEAVPTPCAPKLDPRPALMTKAEVQSALTTAPSFDDRVKLLTGQLLLYMGWMPEVEAGLNGCMAVPQTKGPGN